MESKYKEVYEGRYFQLLREALSEASNDLNITEARQRSGDLNIVISHFTIFESEFHSRILAPVLRALSTYSLGDIRKIANSSEDALLDIDGVGAQLATCIYELFKDYGAN